MVGVSLLAASILGGSVQAATPSWPVGHGTNYLASPAPSSGASSSSVSAGNTVGFYEWLHNPGSSNISQLYLNVTSTPAASVAGAAWTIQNDAGTVLRSGVCANTTTWLCSFGALNAGETVYVTTAFTTASGLADGSTQSVGFNFNATGIPPGGNKSHGDNVSITDKVSISSNDDAAGDFNFNSAAGLTVSTVSVGGLNTQSTSVTIANTQVGAAVADGAQLSTPCNPSLTSGFPTWFKCSALTSLTSTLEYGNGGIFNNPNGAGTPGIVVTVSFASAPNQLHGGHPYVYHYWTDASGAHAELITTPCTPSAGFPSNLGPCLTVGTNSVTIWLLHNGGMRF